MIAPAYPTVPPFVSSFTVGIVHVTEQPALVQETDTLGGRPGGVGSAPAVVSTLPSRYGMKAEAVSANFCEIVTSSAVSHQLRVKACDRPARSEEHTPEL